MVESIYFLKPAWCGSHPAGLWPEKGLQPVTRSHRLQAVVCHSFAAEFEGTRISKLSNSCPFVFIRGYYNSFARLETAS